MQAKMMALQEELGRTEVEGCVGDGMVRFRMTGGKSPRGLTIDDRVFTLKDVRVIEDFILAAIDDAEKQADALVKSETEKMMTQLDIPRDFQLPG